jgi:hypothetical protein
MLTNFGIRHAQAALIGQRLGVAPALAVADRGEFTVWVDGDLIGRKESADDEIVAAVERAIRPLSK